MSRPPRARVKAPSRQPSAGAPAEAGPKWTRRAQARPDEILDAALDEFIARGFDAARMEDVAARAGLSKAAVYLYFASKEALLRALIEREVKPVFGQVEAIAASAPDPKAAIRGIAAIVAARAGDQRFAAIPFLVISIANRFPELAAFYRTEVVERAKAALEALVARGVALGQFRAIEPRAVVRALAGPMMFEVIWAHGLKGPSQFGDRVWVEQQLTLLFEGLEAEKPQ